MKAVFLTDIRQMSLQKAPDPVIEKDDQVLLKIEKVGVCGSDVHYYETGRIGSQIVKYPYRVGHECAATVVEVGSSVSRTRVGDRVAVDPAIVCHKCDQCRSGRENTCRNLGFLGTPGQADGCLCEYIVMPGESVFPMPDKMTFEQAVLCEPYAIGIYSVKQALLPKKADIAILGAGPIGLSCLCAAQIQGVGNIYVTDKIDHRVQVAQQVGTRWVANPDKKNIVQEIMEMNPLGLDAVFECAGEQEAIDQALDMMKPGGKIVLVGIPRFDRINFQIDLLRRREVTVINIRRQNGCTQEAVDLVGSGKSDLDFMVTHRFPMERAQEAFELVGGYRDGVIKAIIEFS